MQAERIPHGYCQCGCGEVAPIAKQTDRAIGHVKGEPLRFIRAHKGRWQGPDYLQEDHGFTTPCWAWRKTVGVRGYAVTRVDGKSRPAHIVYFERLVGPVPDGLQLDHLCRVRHCVNPEHLEPVTQRENLRRGAQTKLTPDDVRAIREAAERGVSHPTIASRFGIARGYVSMVVNRKTWADVA